MDKVEWSAYLCEAYACGDVEQMQHALEQGADPNVVWNDNGLLYWAASALRPDMVRLLLRRGAKTAQEPDGDSASLHIAAEKNALEILDLLLAADGKAVLDRYDYLDRTPLMRAVEAGSVEAAQRLLAAGANVNAHDEARIGTNALLLAAERGDSEMTALLLKFHADPFIPGWMGLTAWDKAKLRKSPEGLRVRALIEQAMPAHKLPAYLRQTPPPRKRKK